MLRFAYLVKKGRKFTYVLLGVGIFVAIDIVPFWSDVETLSQCLWVVLGILGMYVFLETTHWIITYFIKEDERYVVCADGKIRKKDSKGKPIYTEKEFLEEEAMKQFTGEGSESDQILNKSDDRAPIRGTRRSRPRDWTVNDEMDFDDGD